MAFEAEKDTGRPRKWLYWDIRPGQLTSDQAYELIKTPGRNFRRESDPALLAGMDIHGLQMDLPQAWNLWNNRYKKAWGVDSTMYITQFKQPISPAIDRQPCYYWTPGVLLGTRTGAAARYNSITGQWERLSPAGGSLIVGAGTNSTTLSSQGESSTTMPSGTLRFVKANNLTLIS